MTDIVTASIIDALELGADFDLDDTSVADAKSVGDLKVIIQDQQS